MSFYIPPHFRVESNIKEPKQPFTEITDGLKVTTNSPYGKLDSLESLNCARPLGFNNPTTIQKYAIPAVLNNHPLLCRAPTGLGKTLCFLLPLIENIKFPIGIKICILAPTRELCMQIGDEARKISKKLVVECAYGGFRRLSSYSNVNILVAAPGRLLDLLRSDGVNFSYLTNFVLDEADKLLEMGFEKEIRAIKSFIPKTATTFLFSATYHKNLNDIINEFLPSNRVFIEVQNETLLNIKQSFLMVPNKNEKLKELLLENSPLTEKILIFTQRKVTTQELETKIRDWGYPVSCIHGDKIQVERQQALNRFKRGEVNILVATSVAARGIDVQDIKIVINYDFPSDSKEYIHRIGRTGRQGKEGIAISFMPKELAPDLKTEIVNIIKESGNEVPSFFTNKEYKPNKYKEAPIKKTYKKDFTKKFEELSLSKEKSDSEEDLPGEW